MHYWYSTYYACPVWCFDALKTEAVVDAYEDGNISENATEPKTEDICDTDLRRSRFNDSVFC